MSSIRFMKHLLGAANPKKPLTAQPVRFYCVNTYGAKVAKMDLPLGPSFKTVLSKHDPLVKSLESFYQKRLRECAAANGEAYESVSNKTIRHAYHAVKADTEAACSSYVSSCGGEAKVDMHEVVFLSRFVPRAASRGAMKDHEEIRGLCQRDHKEHGDHHGPTVESTRKKYPTAEEMKRASKTTSKAYDAKAGIESLSPPPGDKAAKKGR